MVGIDWQQHLQCVSNTRRDSIRRAKSCNLICNTTCSPIQESTSLRSRATKLKWECLGNARYALDTWKLLDHPRGAGQVNKLALWKSVLWNRAFGIWSHCTQQQVLPYRQGWCQDLWEDMIFSNKLKPIAQRADPTAVFKFLTSTYFLHQHYSIFLSAQKDGCLTFFSIQAIGRIENKDADALKSQESTALWHVTLCSALLLQSP